VWFNSEAQQILFVAHGIFEHRRLSCVMLESLRDRPRSLMHICSSSFRRVFSGIFAVLLILSLPQTLKAQDPTEALGAVRQANARLVAGVRNGSATTADTRATLTARFAQLETVIRTTPALARSYALDATTRSALLKADPSYAALLERDVPQTGELTAVIGDDFTNHAANTHYMLHTMTADISLSFTTDHGTSLDRMLHHQVTVTGVGLPDVVAAETIREASPVEIQNCAVPTGTSVSLPRLSGPLSGDLASQVKAAVINPGAATAACSTFGNQTTAILILNFAGGTATYPGNYGTHGVLEHAVQWSGPLGSEPGEGGQLRADDGGGGCVWADHGPRSV
jgi:hypothetical protein